MELSNDWGIILAANAHVRHQTEVPIRAGREQTKIHIEANGKSKSMLAVFLPGENAPRPGNRCQNEVDFNGNENACQRKFYKQCGIDHAALCANMCETTIFSFTNVVRRELHDFESAGK